MLDALLLGLGEWGAWQDAKEEPLCVCVCSCVSPRISLGSLGF